MLAVDCFCGAGGGTQGLVDAGFEVSLGLDLDQHALSVYRSNHIQHPAVCLDLSDISLAVETIRRAGHVDLISASPPCQDYSCSGSRVEGARASLTVLLIKIALSLHPRCVLMENVNQILLSKAYREAKQLLVASGYSVLELRVNAAACGVAQVRRRIFVLAVRDCDPAVLRQVKRDAAAYNRTPDTGRTVGDCLTTPADTYFYPARNTHVPMVRSTATQAPTFTTGCLTPPPPQYIHRHDDAGPLCEAHVLTVADAAAIASFPTGYFDGARSKTVAGRLIGNCVPPAMMQVVARWCALLLSSPIRVDCTPTVGPAYIRQCNRQSRVQKLVDGGILKCGAVQDADGLRYVVGGDEGDSIVEAVMGCKMMAGWTLVVRLRRNESRNRLAPLDDLLITVPGIAQPFRSCRQVMRCLNLRQDKSGV